MITHKKLSLIGLVAAALMALSTGPATARNLSISNQSFRFSWRALAFQGHGGIINPTLSCPVTLEGSFHYRTIAKSPGALIGHVTTAAVDNPSCEGAQLTVLTETLPWHVTYDRFEGTLPRITGITLLLHTTAFQLETLGLLCLYAENGRERVRATARREAVGGLTSLVLDNTIRLFRISGSSFCPPEFSLEGTAEVSLLGTTTRITVTLI